MIESYLFMEKPDVTLLSQHKSKNVPDFYLKPLTRQLKERFHSSFIFPLTEEDLTNLRELDVAWKIIPEQLKPISAVINGPSEEELSNEEPIKSISEKLS